MVLLHQYISLINISNITFQYQCCDTFCTFPGETCDRTRDSFCVCKTCMCSNDSSLQEEQGGCKAHCNIERLKEIIYEKGSINEGLEEEEKTGNNDCVFISGFGIASFCGNILGIVVGILFYLRYKYSQRSSSHDLQNTHEPKETDSFSLIDRKDSGINDDSGDEVGTTLKSFNTRRIMTNVADYHMPSKVLVSGRHDDINIISHNNVQEEDMNMTSEHQDVMETSSESQTIVDITCGKTEVQCILDY